MLQLLTTRNRNLPVKYPFSVKKFPFLRAKVGTGRRAFGVWNTSINCFGVVINLQRSKTVYVTVHIKNGIFLGYFVYYKCRLNSKLKIHTVRIKYKTILWEVTAESYICSCYIPSSYPHPNTGTNHYSCSYTYCYRFHSVRNLPLHSTDIQMLLHQIEC